MPLGSFEESDVWKEARQLKKAIRALTNTFPPEEKYRLTDQIIRSSRSVGAQIAEGHSRKTNADESRYCIIARGSLSETINHVIDAFHNVHGQEVAKRFFLDERKQNNAIRLSDDFFLLGERPQYSNLAHETEARWRLVET
ncbi:MAG: four helix bundle protein, partial [Chitinophagaceae bacterium]|nr:four helix bundle protein [Chitinophagaceae bacterium]